MLVNMQVRRSSDMHLEAAVTCALSRSAMNVCVDSLSVVFPVHIIDSVIMFVSQLFL